jgi:hypothetical protein
MKGEGQKVEDDENRGQVLFAVARLVNVRALEEQLAQHDKGPAITLGPGDRDRLLALGQDLPSVWDSAGASVETRKKIIRLLIEEIVVDIVADKMELIIH